MTNIKKENSMIRKSLRELTLLDRFLFDIAMGIPEIAHNILSIIMGEELPEISIGISERTKEPYYDSRAIRLDLLAFDEEDTVYDAEAQPRYISCHELARRSRFYQGVIDASLLQPGEIKFSKLNDIYIIFIAPFDPFGKKKYRYTFKETCKEIPELTLEDGAVRIFLNTRGTNADEESPELVELLSVMNQTFEEDNLEIQSPRIRLLAKQVKTIKNNQEVGVRYMRFLEELEQEKREYKIEIEKILREKLRKELAEEVRNEVKEEVRDEVKEEVRDEVKEEVRDEVKEEVRKEVKKEAVKDFAVDFLNAGFPKDMIKKILMERYELSEAEAAATLK